MGVASEADVAFNETEANDAGVAQIGGSGRRCKEQRQNKCGDCDEYRGMANGHVDPQPAVRRAVVRCGGPGRCAECYRSMVSRGASGVKPAKCQKIVKRMNCIEILFAKFS